MNEKYGIELEAKVDKFKAVMQSTANYVKNLARDMKDAMTVAPKSTLYQGMSKNDLQKELEKQQSIARQMQENMSAKNIDTTGSVFIKSKQMYAEAISRVSILRNRIREANNELEKTEQISTKNDSGLSNVFKKGISNIKRFSFYLLGARSVFSLFMKYQNIYNQYNQQMQYQTELSQNAIALSLAPAYELLGNVIAYVSIGFARFIELLTGINVLSKVSTKGIRDYNKSLKETQTLVAGVDEITNLTMPNSTGLAGQYQALDDFRKKINEIDKWFKEQTWLQNIIKTFQNWYDSVGKDSIKTIKQELGDIWENGKQIFKTIAEILNIDLGKYLKNATLFIESTVIVIDVVASTIAFMLQAIKDISNFDFDNLKSNFNEWKSEMKSNFGELKENIKVAFDNTDEKTKNTFDELDKRITTSKNKVEDLANQDYEAKIELTLKENKNNSSVIERFKSGLSRGLETGIKTMFKSVGLLIPGFPHANGLDYVPYDNYPALLHKGEAVVPAKYNPAIHSTGNDYTNSLLETLVVKMDDLASRPNVFEVDGQKFATATYGLYKGQENRQNYNTNVVVK